MVEPTPEEFARQVDREIEDEILRAGRDHDWIETEEIGDSGWLAVVPVALAVLAVALTAGAIWLAGG